MIEVTLSLFIVFIMFQLLYIFIPLFTVKETNSPNKCVEKAISILIPAYNEEDIIENCLKGINHLQYSNFEAIFINDGSNDQTFEKLEEHLQLIPIERPFFQHLSYEQVKGFYQSKTYPSLYVLDKNNGGKADALNAGIDYSMNEIIITLDADSVLEPTSLQAINYSFEDKKVLAAGGMVQIIQGIRGSHMKPQPFFKMPNIIRYQILQYLTDFYLHKTTQAKLKSITVIAGAFGAFRKSALLEVHGYRKTVGEDLDITLKIQSLIKKKYKNHKLIFVPAAICYTECPSTFKSLFSQRIRWQKGFIDCLLTYRKSYYTKLGFSVSTYIIIDSFILGTLSAFPAASLPIILIFQDSYMIALCFLTITFFLACYRSITAIIISKRYGFVYSGQDYLRMAFFIPFEILTYRLLGLVFATVGTLLYFKNKDGWKPIDRIGTNHQTYEKKNS